MPRYHGRPRLQKLCQRIAVILFLLLVFPCRAALKEGTMDLDIFLKLVSHTRFRTVADMPTDLEPYFAYLEDDSKGEWMEGWRVLVGEVVQILGEEGMIIRYFESAGTHKGKALYFGDIKTGRLKNYYLQSRCTDGEKIYAIAKKEDESFSYTTTLGARSTVRSFDFGKEPNAVELSLLKKSVEIREQAEAQRKEAERRSVEELVAKQKQAAEAAKAKKLQEADAKTVEFQKKQAEQGSAYAQLELGKRYMEGKGVEQSNDLARKWLTAAADQGNEHAKKLLNNIR